MKIEISGYSAVGRRKNNEDAFYHSSDGISSCLAIVCDGLGGHGEGEVASNAAVNLISESLNHHSLDVDELEDAIIAANNYICSIHPESDYPKTTVSLLWLQNGFAYVANVGDTRVYHFRNNEILYQSVDHSVAYLAYLSGQIGRSEIRYHKDQNKLTRCLGSSGTLKIDRKRISVLPGDSFLLCSDGFWEHITEQEIIDSGKRTEDAASWLTEMAKQVFPQENDNHTAIAVKIL